MKKTQIFFNEQEHKNALNNYELQADAINKAMTLSKSLTNEEVNSYKIEDVENWLTKKSGFPSASQSAKLLEKNIQYIAFLDHYNSFKNSADADINKRFTMTENGYILNEAFLVELTEQWTTYLPRELEEVNAKLEKIVILLNEADNMEANSTTSIKRNYEGTWAVNVQALHLSFQLR